LHDQDFEQQKTMLFFCFQLGVPFSHHASERLSREAKRLDSRERRGILPRAKFATSLLLSSFLHFLLVPNWLF
jgi:hypothetical protein